MSSIVETEHTLLLSSHMAGCVVLVTYRELLAPFRRGDHAQAVQGRQPKLRDTTQRRKG